MPSTDRTRFCNSQTCTTQSRILVARSGYDEVVDAGGRPASQDRTVRSARPVQISAAVIT